MKASDIIYDSQEICGKWLAEGLTPGERKE